MIGSTPLGLGSTKLATQEPDGSGAGVETITPGPGIIISGTPQNPIIGAAGSQYAFEQDVDYGYGRQVDSNIPTDAEADTNFWIGPGTDADHVGQPMDQVREFRCPERLSGLRLYGRIVFCQTAGVGAVLTLAITVDGVNSAVGTTIPTGTVNDLNVDVAAAVDVLPGQMVGLRLFENGNLTDGSSLRCQFKILGQKTGVKASPFAWYRSSDLTTLADPVTKKVSGWGDYTGNGYDVAQATTFLQPVLEQNIFGQPGAMLPGLRFDIEQHLNRAVKLLGNGAPRTVLALVKPSSAFGGTVCTFQNSAKAFNALWETLSGKQYVWGDDIPGASEPPDAIYRSGAPIDNTDQKIVISWRVQPNLALDVAVNGANQALVAGSILADDGTPNWRIGDQQDLIDIRGWLGWLGELLVFDGALSTSDLAFWTTYLRERGGTG